MGAAVPAAALACDPHTTDPTNRYIYSCGTCAWINGWLRGLNGGITWADAEADIEEMSPHVYDDPNATNKSNFSYGWVMLADSNLDRWAQIGPDKANDGTRFDFAQCSGTTLAPSDGFFTPSATGTTPTFKVENVSDGKNLYINGNLEMFCGFTFTPSVVIVSSEIHNLDDQVPGERSNHQTYRNATAHDGNGAQYSIFASGQYQSGAASWDKWVKNADTSGDGWDGDCS